MYGNVVARTHACRLVQLINQKLEAYHKWIASQEPELDRLPANINLRLQLKFIGSPISVAYKFCVLSILFVFHVYSHSVCLSHSHEISFVCNRCVCFYAYKKSKSNTSFCVQWGVPFNQLFLVQLRELMEMYVKP